MLDVCDEFLFELRTCHWVEQTWSTVTDSDTSILVARQLGTRYRRWDTIVIECTPAGLERRARFGPKHLDSDLLHIVRHAPDSWDYYRDVLPTPEYPWRYVREAIHEANDRGILDVRKRGNRIEIRRRWPYPDWIERIVAIENKPDLNRSAARALGRQLTYDVAESLADEVWLATGQTGARIEPVLFEGIPVEVGIVTIDPETLAHDVLWHPRTLPVQDSGTRITENPPADAPSQSAARFDYIGPAEKASTRLEIAERAYERGWRSFIDSMRPDCRHFELRCADGQLLPFCRAKGRNQSITECSGSCDSFEPEPPNWRTNGWPIDGGPGKCCRNVLAKRRRYRRPGLTSDSS